MSDSKSSEREGNVPGVLGLNIVGLLVTYSVTLLFCAKKALDQSGDPSAETWLKAILDGVCITTLTYTFTQSINNLAMDAKMRAFIFNVGILSADLPYILMYGFWETKYFPLNVVLCFYTIVLVVLTSWSLHLTVKTQESGQANRHTIKPGEVAKKNETPQKGYLPEE